MQHKVTNTQKALNIWAIILIIWSIYRTKYHFPEWFDEFIAKPLIFILPIFIYIKSIEKKSFFSNLYLKTKGLWNELSLGLVVGLTFLISIISGDFIKYHSFSFLTVKLSSSNLIFLTLSIAFATAISEEILSRGFILKRLYEESKNIYKATFFSSILFFFIHVPNLFANNNINGNILIAFICLDFILSIVNSIIFLERKSLFLPILIHTFYNFSLILFV